MIIFFDTDENGYVDGWGSTRSNENEIEIKLDKEHDFFKSDMHAWQYLDNELVFDEDKQQQLVDERKQEDSTPSELEQVKQENDRLAMALMDLAEKTLSAGGDE